MDASNRDFELSCTKDKVGMGGRSANNQRILPFCIDRLLHPKGSPTTRKAMSDLSAPARISSLDDSTISRSATIIERS